MFRRPSLQQEKRNKRGKPQDNFRFGMSFRRHLLNLIAASGISDRSLSLLAAGNPNTVRDLRRGVNSSLDTIEALLRMLGLRLTVFIPVLLKEESS